MRVVDELAKTTLFSVEHVESEGVFFLQVEALNFFEDIVDLADEV